MYHHFGLVLMVNHACNLRCSYCYTGDKFSRRMNPDIGRRCVDRAIASLNRHGTLELGFFGGEPLIESRFIGEVLDYARNRLQSSDINLSPSLTTNGTQTDSEAWTLMTRPDLDLVVSHDGLPDIHDRHRRTVDGQGSSAQVVRTIQRLLEHGKEFRVLSVVRPDTIEYLAEGIQFLNALGVRYIEPSLDLWSQWNESDIQKIESAVSAAADIWRDSIPDHGVSCLDEKLVQLTSLPTNESARCGFGDGQIAVAPSGNLYPCERLIGEDLSTNPMRLTGHALLGDDFLSPVLANGRANEPCNTCSRPPAFNTICPCSNYVRTGDVSKSDAVLSAWNQACFEQAARVLEELSITVHAQAPVGANCGVTAWSSHGNK